MIQIHFVNNISNVLNVYKERYGITKTWIAKQMGISLQSLASLENSDNPTIKMLIKLSAVLNCPITDLFYYTVIKDKS